MNHRLQSLRQILPLAWPVFIGQLAVLAYSTIDTLLVARHSSLDLAALAVGSAVYTSVFVGLMGVVLAISPVAGQLFGAKRMAEAGDSLHQAAWLALMLAAVGELVLWFPQPFLAISHASPEIAAKVSAYLRTLGIALPAALLFTAYRGFNTAVSRPKAVMALQIGGLLLKFPASALLIGGFSLGPVTVPALGAVGCAMATAIVMWSQLLLALVVLRRDPFYSGFGFARGGLHRPRRATLARLVKLGVPMGASVLIEVTGFTFMAIFIARIGSTAVAGHQLAANLVAMMFMMPLALANASSTLVAQALGARDAAGARRLGWHGLELAVGIAFVLGALIFSLREQVLGLYTRDTAIIAAALPLLGWVWIFHVADAGQTVSAFVLRAHHIATAPMVIYALAIWGLGLGGGYWLAFGDHAVALPTFMQGAMGFWSAASAGLVAAALGLSALLAWVHRTQLKG
ncbi:MATE family efflux transporter [Roseateles depolymerans]|uniref:Putative efflux protein, MATE family n=1 Tax=Roseateles depolymerans TaxID=76731 RepID=A0A0U3LRK9_9BURK|nr:MATE family efflux transporter [Roseateles depolymerans]ALV07655.1 Putative efflux protein, MATE family [Roseateles depolymerans]REG22123.1 MATE family multidrug resistance protein [Roseateles depolymerans]